MKKRLAVKTGILLTFIFLICFQTGCVTNKHKYQAYLDMKDFVLDELNPRGRYFLFFETNVKNEIYFTEASHFQYVLHYKLNVDSIKKASFFKDLMLGKIILSCEDFGDCFTLSSEIINKYKQEGIENFAKIYATYKEEYGVYHINSSLSYDEQLSIAYFFYLNNIYTAVNCEECCLYSVKNMSGTPADDDIDWDSILIKEE